MTEYDQLSVTEDTKEEFQSFRRRLEADRDEDMSQDEMVRWLLDKAGAYYESGNPNDE